MDSQDNDDFTRLNIGDFVNWLFDYAELQDDDYYSFCHRVYDELIYQFLEDMRHA